MSTETMVNLPKSYLGPRRTKVFFRENDQCTEKIFYYIVLGAYLDTSLKAFYLVGCILVNKKKPKDKNYALLRIYHSTSLSPYPAFVVLNINSGKIDIKKKFTWICQYHCDPRIPFDKVAAETAYQNWIIQGRHVYQRSLGIKRRRQESALQPDEQLIPKSHRFRDRVEEDPDDEEMEFDQWFGRRQIHGELPADMLSSRSNKCTLCMRDASVHCHQCITYYCTYKCMRIDFSSHDRYCGRLHETLG